MIRVIFFTILLAIILGGAYFYDREKKETVPKKTASIEEAVKNNKTSEENSDSNQSIFSELFSGLKEQFSKEGESQNQPENKESLETQALKEEIRNYLIQSSDINFPQDSQTLGLALLEAEGGDPIRLMQIRDEFKTKLVEFKKLTPPKEMEEIHNQSIKVVEDFIKLMEDTIQKTKGSVKETWGSELQEINSRAGKIKGEIIKIVDKYNIDLPSEVLSR